MIARKEILTVRMDEMNFDTRPCSQIALSFCSNEKLIPPKTKLVNLQIGDFSL